MCLAQRNVVENDKYFIAGYNMACSTICYMWGSREL